MEKLAKIGSHQEVRAAYYRLRELVSEKKLNVARISSRNMERLKNEITQNVRWDDNQALFVYGILQLYNQDLRVYGVNLSRIPYPIPKKEPEKEKQIVNHIGYNGESFVIGFKYSPDLVDKLKNAFPRDARRYNEKNKTWEVPVTQIDALKKFSETHDFKLSDRAAQVLFGVEENLEQSYSAARIELNLPLRKGKEMFDYQTVGVDFGIRNRCTLIADQMGLGKTIQAIGVALGVKKWPILVICPKSLRLNWQREWDVWTNQKVVIGTEKVMKYIHRWIELNQADVVICNYDSLEKYFVDHIEEKEDKNGKKRIVVHLNKNAELFKGVIIDEAHELRNEKIKRYKIVRELIKPMKMRVALTGTPIVNSPNDMASQLELLGHLDEFGGRFKFNKRYSGLKKTHFGYKNGEASNLEELNIKLRSTCMIRREKHQVLSLPDKIRTTHEVELSNQKDYDHAELSLQDYLAKNGASTEKISAAVRAETIVRMQLLGLLSAKGKILAFVEFAERMFMEDEKLVVFVWHKEIISELRKHFPNLLEISGNTTDDEIEENKRKLKQPGYNLIVATYGRGSVGHTLVESCNYVALELAWTDAIQSQSEDRIHRIGQKHTTYCHYFMGKDTLDHWRYGIIEAKMNMSKQATGSSEDISVVQSSLVDMYVKKLNKVA